MGKGSKRRPSQVPKDEVDRRWTNTFGEPIIWCGRCGKPKNTQHTRCLCGTPKERPNV